MFAQFKSLLDYNSKTGDFTWKVSRGKAKAGSDAGCVDAEGYRVIRIYGKNYKAHRLAWLLTHGAWPALEIDHKNGDRADNRICNLRLATTAENRRNSRRSVRNVSGFKGVGFRKNRQKWIATIVVSGRTFPLGSFETPGEAHCAYTRAAERFFGEFANSG